MHSLIHKIDKESQVKSFSINNHIKIWFSKPEASSPLGGLKNELRLIRLRGEHPDKKIQLIYEPNSLLPEAKEKISYFCKKHHITLISIDDIERDLDELYVDGYIDTESYDCQKKLLKYARKEVAEEFGNLAAASDIIRTITSVLIDKKTKSPRLYSDMDNHVSSRKKELVIPEKSTILIEGSNSCLFSPFPENEYLKLIRSQLLNQYSKPGGAIGISKNKQYIFAIMDYAKSRNLYSDFFSRGGFNDFIVEFKSFIEHRYDETTPEIDIFDFRRLAQMFLLENSGDAHYPGYVDKLIAAQIIMTSGPELYYSQDRYNTDLSVIDGNLIDSVISSDLSWLQGPSGDSYRKSVTSMERAGHKLATSLGALFRGKKVRGTLTKEGMNPWLKVISALKDEDYVAVDKIFKNLTPVNQQTYLHNIALSYIREKRNIMKSSLNKFYFTHSQDNVAMKHFLENYLTDLEKLKTQIHKLADWYKPEFAQRRERPRWSYIYRQPDKFLKDIAEPAEPTKRLLADTRDIVPEHPFKNFFNTSHADLSLLPENTFDYHNADSHDTNNVNQTWPIKMSILLNKPEHLTYLLKVIEQKLPETGSLDKSKWESCLQNTLSFAIEHNHIAAYQALKSFSERNKEYLTNFEEDLKPLFITPNVFDEEEIDYLNSINIDSIYLTSVDLDLSTYHRSC